MSTKLSNQQLDKTIRCLNGFCWLFASIIWKFTKIYFGKNIEIFTSFWLTELILVILPWIQQNIAVCKLNIYGKRCNLNLRSHTLAKALRRSWSKQLISWIGRFTLNPPKWSHYVLYASATFEMEGSIGFTINSVDRANASQNKSRFDSVSYCFCHK